MRIVIEMVQINGEVRFICLNKDKLEIKSFDDVLLVDCTYKDRLNCLLTLFTFKEDWVSEDCDNYIYKVKFDNNGDVDVYCFNNVPSNFNLFMGHLVRLIGE